MLCFAYASSYASRVFPLMAGLLGNAEVLDSGCRAEGCMLHTAPNIRSSTIYMYILFIFLNRYMGYMYHALLDFCH